ncbi:MAG: 23S rRNA (pseudouridine(1915)-N(3))-methyltransferase RlmH [Clostridia bacterium]|nr:23S rRNA (pseudouridine(1915)-N(3))-methyltransferase RlmH [Clostridia bacterium]
MINITVIATGKLKEKYMRDFSDEYRKRLSAFCNLNIVELAPKPISDNPSEKEIQNALKAEAELIKKKIPKDAYVFSMCIEGKQMPSEAFSKKLSNLAVSGRSSLVFVLGSSFGLDPEIKRLSDERFSMSEMTFPHQMARVMLLEQLYRALQIESGGKYHK